MKKIKTLITISALACAGGGLLCSSLLTTSCSSKDQGIHFKYVSGLDAETHSVLQYSLQTFNAFYIFAASTNDAFEHNGVKCRTLLIEWAITVGTSYYSQTCHFYASYTGSYFADYDLYVKMCGLLDVVVE